MLRGFFVTGTDTGVGKTVVCAALVHRLQRSAPVRYWKPVQTGTATDDDTAVVRRLSGGGPAAVLDAGARFARPLSPHLAARLEGRRVDVRTLVAPLRQYARDSRWIVEGAGGVLVPLNGSALLIDMMERLQLPVVVAARSTLGTINHTLLTLEAVRARRLTVAGVVLIGPPNRENRLAIERHGRVPVIGELPPLRPLTARRLQHWARTRLDRAGRLDEV